MANARSIGRLVLTSIAVKISVVVAGVGVCRTLVGIG